MIEHHRSAALGEAEVHALEALCLVAQAADGFRPLSDDLWLELTGPATAGSRVVIDRRDGHVIGSAHLSHPPGHWQLELVVHPRHRHTGVERELLDHAVSEIGSDGGGEVVLWSYDPDSPTLELIDRAGFSTQRELLRMECALPLSESVTWPDEVTARAFRDGDEAAVLALNNRAFSDHPEQGSWTVHTLRTRMTQDWFDPAGFVIAEDDAGIVGFCWTKLHADEAAGEIYVIAVDPARQGAGLGRALVVAGLHSIADRDVTRGILYVDADNRTAVGLYEALGFARTRVNRAFTLTVDGQAAGSGNDESP